MGKGKLSLSFAAAIKRRPLGMEGAQAQGMGGALARWSSKALRGASVSPEALLLAGEVWRGGRLSKINAKHLFHSIRWKRASRGQPALWSGAQRKRAGRIQRVRLELQPME